MRAGNAKPVTVPSGRLTTSPMLVTGTGLWSPCHTKFVTVPSQDRVRIAASAPDRSSASSAVDVILMTLNMLVRSPTSWIIAQTDRHGEFAFEATRKPGLKLGTCSLPCQPSQDL